MPQHLSSENARAAVNARWANTPAGEEAIRRLVKAAPRLTEDQKARIRAVLDAPTLTEKEAA